ncbi:MAG TPA: prepilin peptidase [Candidatus Limnocylindria bacterium]|nr:prepilin peptidase [Candidatus Limnocylindria bacterium]
MQFIILGLTFIFGAAIGSFLNVVILRLPEEEKLNGRSHCLNCQHQLTVWDLIPILSFVFLGGKCRYCKKQFSPRYFVIELVTALLFALCCQLLKPDSLLLFILLLKYCFVASVLVVVFVIDLEHFLILDSVIFPGIIVLFALNLGLSIIGKQPVLNGHSYFISGLLGSVLAPLPFFVIWYFSGGKWMGFGDVKLAIFLGAALAFPLVFVGIMVGILLGGATSIFLLAFASQTLKSRIPFGTFLSLGAMLSLFYGERLLNWYLSILGF